MQLKIETNSDSLALNLAAFATKQMPFAVAKTLTGLAYDVRDKENSRLDEYFKLRTPWAKKSLKVVAAQKAMYPNCFSVVGVRDKILALNITGGEREGATPGLEARQILNPGKQTLGPAYFPKKIVQGKRKFKGNRPFIFTSTTGKTEGKLVEAIRIGKERTPLAVLYVLGDTVNIQKRWPFIENARQTINQNYKQKLNDNLNRAIQTARK